ATQESSSFASEVAPSPMALKLSTASRSTRISVLGGHSTMNSLKLIFVVGISR
ncbi:hypothetical protein HAX54_032198, partial [Datura stramonium]|nr:hypothetical protein [Datura stramonium]